MADREKLTDVIYSMDICSWDWAGKIADHLLANGVTFAKDTNVPSWIPVSERLPKEYTKVLVIDRVTGKVDIAQINAFGCFVYADGRGHGASHWMPLPEPPKED